MSRVYCLFILIFVLQVEACAWPKPYIFEENKFARVVNEEKLSTSLSKIIKICYNSSRATPKEINNLAEERCLAQGMKLAFLGQSRKECPLLTPISAVYECTKP